MAALATAHPEVAHVRCTTKRGDSIDGTIAKPLISLKVKGDTHTDLEYTVRFASGTLHFDYEKPEDFDMKDWVIAFDVGLDSIDIEEGSEEHKEVKAAINQAGDYSIKSLFLTFNLGSLTKLNMAHCDFRGANLDEDDRISLGSLLAKWYIDDGPMTDRQKRTIGYGLHTSDPSSVNKDAVEFPPTSLKFQTYGYIAPNKTEPDEGIGAGDNNMLLYLQMTNKKKFPSDPVLRYSGNFATSGMDGTMAIERSIFWDSYLLRTTNELLHKLNRATYVWIKYANVDNIKKPQWEIGVGDSGSSNSATPEFFHWDPDPTNTMSWTWGPRHGSEQYRTLEHYVGFSWADLTVNCTTSNTMSTKSGSNQIKIGGKSNIKVDATWNNGSLNLPLAAKYSIHVWLEWSTTITIKGVGSGGLEMELDLNDKNFKVDNEPIMFDGDEWEITESDVVSSQGAIQNKLKKGLENSDLRSVKKALKESLNSTARFVVPGQGTFSYDDPVFNDKGDLFIKIGYQDC